MFGESMMKGTLMEVKTDTPQETIEYFEKEYNVTVVREGMDENKREMWRKLNSKSGK